MTGSRVGKSVYWALSADLAGSRKIVGRGEAGRRIEAALKSLRRRFKGEWVAPPVTTRGIDEMSAAMKSPRRVFDFLTELNTAIWPHRFRLGLGAGTLDVGARSTDAADMDGPAFHRAATALRRAGRERIFFAVELPGIPAAEAALAQAGADLHAELMRRWTPGAHRAVEAFRQAGTQEKAARRLKVSQQSVSKELARAAEGQMRQLQDAVRLWLESVGPRVESA